MARKAPAAKAVHTLTIDDWQPHLLNVLLRMHWAKRLRAAKAAAAIIAAEVRNQGIPKASGRRRVSLVIRHRKAVTPPDPDALQKVTFDALVRAGLLIDDSGTWLELGTVTFEVAERKGLVVVMEDV